MLNSAAQRWTILIPRCALAAGLAMLALPTLVSLARWSWSTEEGTHGPIVLATGTWLVWRERRAFDPEARNGIVLPAMLLVSALVAYGLGRIISLFMLETAALYAIFVATALMLFGSAWVRKLWFPLMYLLFVIPLPPNIVASATQPLKLLIADYAVKVLSACGYAVGGTGAVIQVDQYELFVATACTGINSMVGIIAVCFFFVYLNHENNWRLSVMLAFCIVPLGIVLNFLRVVVLILQTHYWGDAFARGLAHQLGGFVMFSLAIGALLVLEMPLNRLAGKTGRIFHPKIEEGAPLAS